MRSPSLCLAVVISANTEWKVVRKLFPQARVERSPFGEWFRGPAGGLESSVDWYVVQGGWGKISAAASAQYTLDRWHPDVLINLGTCGGFAGYVQKGEILLAERTCVYDISEQMTDPAEAIAFYSSSMDLSWLAEPYPQPVHRGLLLSADRDLVAGEIPGLIGQYAGVAGDWESGAIAWVAQKNQVRCLILRGVTDLVGPEGGEAYSDFSVYENGTRQVMEDLFSAFPGWVRCISPAPA